MQCRVYPVPGGAAFVCGRREPAKRCRCGRPATVLCDFPLTGAKSGKTCDRPLCTGCRVVKGPDKDYCQAHDAMESAPAKPVPVRPPPPMQQQLALPIPPKERT